MENKHIVGISDFKVATAPDKIITFALGSCVGITLFDRLTGIGGMAHIMLPDSALIRSDTNPKKFANTALPLLWQEMEQLGAKKFSLIAKIAGGAMLFGKTDALRIGERNIMAVKDQLQKLGIRIMAEDTGLNYGRTMELDLENGRVTIKTTLHGIQEL